MLDPLNSVVCFGALFNRDQGLVDNTAIIVIETTNIMMTMLRTDFLMRRINSILFDYILDIIYHVLVAQSPAL